MCNQITATPWLYFCDSPQASNYQHHYLVNIDTGIIIELSFRPPGHPNQSPIPPTLIISTLTSPEGTALTQDGFLAIDNWAKMRHFATDLGYEITSTATLATATLTTCNNEKSRDRLDQSNA